MKNRMSEGFQMIHDLFRLRWIPEILSAIHEGKEGYNEILNAIEGISNTELNRKLAVLLEKNAIEKKSHGGYQLLDFGHDLEHIFSHFEEMSKKYLA